MALVGDSYEYYDKRFYDLTVPIAAVEQLYDNCRWAEGPVWFNEHSTLIWSDIPNQRLLRWTEGVGVSEFRTRSNFANGNTRDSPLLLSTGRHTENHEHQQSRQNDLKTKRRQKTGCRPGHTEVCDRRQQQSQQTAGQQSSDALGDNIRQHVIPGKTV